MKKAILINDTSKVFHYGCQLVGEHIKKGLLENNIQIQYSLLYRENNIIEEIEKYLGKSSVDFIVINGEGSIHHRRKVALQLISIGQIIKKSYPNVKIVLLNATIQEMGDSIHLLKYFDLIQVRERKTYSYLEENHIKSFLAPDLSLYTQKVTNTGSNSTIVGGSVIGEKMKENIKFARKNNLPFRDTLYLPKGSNTNPISLTKKILYLICKKINYIFGLHIGIRNPQKDIENLSQYNRIITGRFHDIYLAILAGSDFFVLRSNSYKMEGTLEYIGLENNILEDINDISDFKNMSFSKGDKEKVDIFYKNGISQIQQLFNSISKL